MLHTDIPTRGEIEALAAATDDWCVSIYTPTESDSANPDQNRIAFWDQVRRALDSVTDPEARAALEEEFDLHIDDAEFWRYQSRTLVTLATPTRIRTYRVPNQLNASATVGERFYLKRLLRVVTFPQSAFVLALAEGGVRLVEVTADKPAYTVRVPGLPASAADHAGKAGLGDRAPKRRVQGEEGRKMRVRQYARAIDTELRDFLAGRHVPLILAATEPIDALFRSVNSYDNLLEESIPGNPERASDQELADRSREILDRHYALHLAQLVELLNERRGEGRGATDISDLARAASAGAVDTLLVDMDASVPGSISADGAVTFGEPTATDAPGILDEISRRVLLTGGRVLAVRAADLPDGAQAAGILRYAL
ncbi:baeRF11 domain-containing protein [Nocardia sp. NBC_00416]|uniref:baeRF11 domain-containing protein n=1 Tax=Nocardia sp. NBC_00416 TaxID=2975991 RepID=UPI002E1FC5A3